MNTSNSLEENRVQNEVTRNWIPFKSFVHSIKGPGVHNLAEWLLKQPKWMLHEVRNIQRL